MDRISERESFTIKALVVRETDVRDNDKFLTLLTAERGRLSVYAHGVHGIKSPYVNICVLASYNEFTIERRGERYTMKEAFQLEPFRALRDDLERFALAQYFCDVCSDVSVEGENESDLLALTLNMLFALSATIKPPRQIKAAFELRCACILGVMPDLDACAGCGCTDSPVMYLDVMSGVIRCAQCRAKQPLEELFYEDGKSVLTIELAPPVLDAMRYVVYAGLKRLCAFIMPDDASMRDFAEVCEKYLTSHLERGYKTLDFYKAVSG
ncbi:MAG: DNA repair protein RecO [Eubacteriales bacterium]